MNREEIINRIAVIDRELEKRRRSRQALSDYNTGRKKHKKQLAFHKCKKRNRWVFGGNRSGKTECGAVEAVWLLRGIHPYRKNKPNVFGWSVSLSQQVQRDVAQSKILKYLPSEWIAEVTMLSGRKDSPSCGVIDQIKIKNVFGGISTLGFKSCDQGREKFQGSSLDFVWFDEEPPKDVYDECLMRVMDKKGDVFGTMTPLKGETFIYNEIYLNRKNNPEVWWETIGWEDNPFLPKSEVKLLSAALDEATLDSRKYGKFSVGAGLVYPEFDRAVHVIPPFAVPQEWQETISIDPGLNNPPFRTLVCRRLGRERIRRRRTLCGGEGYRLPRPLHTGYIRTNRVEDGRQGQGVRTYRQCRKSKNACLRKERYGAVCGKGDNRKSKSQQGRFCRHMQG